MATYNELYVQLKRQLRDSGIEAYALEARLMLSHVCGVSPERLLATLNCHAEPHLEQSLRELTARRIEGEPVAYLTGEWEFYGMPFRVTNQVLIPRSDTEILVEKAIQLSNMKTSGIRILDLCTGTGCIGCSLVSELPKSKAMLIDKSSVAVSLARENAARNRLSRQIDCIEYDIFNSPPDEMGQFDLIVSNPPYIPTAEIDSLDKSVRNYEPHMALNGGTDGLDFYRVILQKWILLLKPSGWILFEVGEGQSDDVASMMQSQGLCEIGTVKDFGGTERVVFGKRP